MTHVLQSPGSRGLDGAEWLRVQHTFYPGYAVVGGTAEVVGLITTTATAVLLRRRGSAAYPPAIAAVCLLGTLLAFAFGNRPINDLIASWTPATLPPDWTAYRDQWEVAHAISTGLALIAFLVLAVTSVPRSSDTPDRA